MRSRIIPIAKKETLHIVRDWRTLLMAFAMPVVMVLLFGYAITLDIKDLRLAVADSDRSQQSRKLTNAMTGSEYFRIVGEATSEDEIADFLDKSIAQTVLAIPRDYSASLDRGEDADVQILVDGAESNTATIAAGYLQKIMLQQLMDAIRERMAGAGVDPDNLQAPINVESRYWYNDELRSQNFIVPGLIAAILMIMTALLTSLTIVGERERGSLEQLIATPVRPYEIMIGKLIPYFCIGMIDAVMVAVIGVEVFKVPFVGDIRLFMLGTAVFAVAGLMIGLRISIAAATQVFAMQLAIIASMLPSYLLSGFMFAIKNMPGWLQVLTYVVPARYLVEILRGIFLKGTDMDLLYKPIAVLCLMAVIFLVMCVKTFKKKIG